MHASALRPEGEESKKKKKERKLLDSADSRVTEVYILFAERVRTHTFILLCFACMKSNLARGL